LLDQLTSGLEGVTQDDLLTIC